MLLWLLLFPVPASAQTGAYAALGAPDTQAFPRIEIFLDVHDAQGDFVRNLQPEQILVMENGAALPAAEIIEMRPGVQIVVALNPGPSFGIRNSQGVSRYDYIKEALSNWGTSRLGTTIDDLSLLITGGPSVSHVTDPAQWLAALDSEEIDARSATPSLDTLFRAVSIAADPTIRPGMGHAVLFITPPPLTSEIQSMDNLSAQAIERGVSIFIWMVSSPGVFATQSVERLMQLAEQTGGKFFAYTGEEALPNPEEYQEPLRSTYRLAYLSNISQGGAHQLVVRVQLNAEQIETNIQTFEMDIQPPQAAFVSPPLSIQRKLSTGRGNSEEKEQAAAELSPKEQPLLVVFDFPDGQKRALAYSALYVDGQVVAENFEPPFDQFIWQLDSYTVDGLHQLQVQIRDVLGLTGSSIEIPVEISVESPSQDAWSVVQSNLLLLSVLAALLAGAVLILVLVIGGKLRPGSLKAARNRRHRSDPVTQPVQIEVEPASSRLSNWVSRLQWSQRQAAPKANAFLSRISDTDNLSIAPPIPITSTEIIFGSDPKQATLVLEHPSIDAVHARLARQENGAFRLADAGSIAGTWVNYTPISKEGAELEHGDLVHIGRIGFRFTLRQPTRIRKPIVIQETSSEESIEEFQP
ncbi:MAG: FHA domain-containing protein [Anaerolineales bacterium]|nr:FHA domain-containing protein [Anaerolineales bacterium]